MPDRNSAVFCNDLWERIQSAARARGVDIKSLAEQAGLGRNSLYNIPRGSVPASDVIARIARILDVTTDHLLGMRPLAVAEEQSPYGQTTEIEILLEGELRPGATLKAKVLKVKGQK